MTASDRMEVFQMRLRKILLLSGCAVLLCVCVLQCVAAARDSAKVFEIDSEPDEILIDNAGSVVKLVQQDGKWFVGERLYPANESSVDSIKNSLMKITALDKVGKLSDDSVMSRYDLGETKRINVTAKAGGEILRSVSVGKASSTGAQSYVVFDGGNDIYLVSGNLNSEFSKTVEELRSKIVYKTEADGISSVSVTDFTGGTEKTWSVSRSGSGEDTVWNFSGDEVQVDPVKASDWFRSVSALSIAAWLGEDEAVSGTRQYSVRISSTDEILLDIYHVPENDGESEYYYGSCSSTPYKFKVPGYVVQKFQKNPGDFEK